MAISLEVPITAYTRGGTTLVSYHKQQNHLLRRTSKEKQQILPKQVGVDQKNIKRERKSKCDFTYKDHTEDPALPDLHIQCSRKYQSNKVKISVHVLYMYCVVTQLLIMSPVEC